MNPCEKVYFDDACIPDDDPFKIRAIIKRGAAKIMPSLAVQDAW